MKNRKKATGIFNLTLVLTFVFTTCLQPATGEGGGRPSANQTVNGYSPTGPPDWGT